jgi:LCP family protein required for cell wall assembly
MLELALPATLMQRLKKIWHSFLELIPEFPGVNMLTGKQQFVDLREDSTRVHQRRVLGKLLFGVAILLSIFLFQINSLLDRIVQHVNQIQGKTKIAYLEYGDTMPLPLKKRYTILVLGKEKENRADTIILCNFMVDLKQVHILSFPRDTRIPLVHNGEESLDKLSHTFRWGGLPLLKSSLSRFYDIHVDHTALIDLAIFRKIIDTLGGVSINVESNLQYQDKSASLIIDVKKGKQILDGVNAEGYVRYRDDRGDLGRIRRQQKFIRAFIKKIRSLRAVSWDSIKVLGRLPRFAVNLFKDIDTDINIDLFLTLLVGFSQVEIGDIHYRTLPGIGEYIYDFEQKKKISYFVTNTKTLKDSRTWFLHSASSNIQGVTQP